MKNGHFNIPVSILTLGPASWTHLYCVQKFISYTGVVDKEMLNFQAESHSIFCLNQGMNSYNFVHTKQEQPMVFLS
jgi:hypothetical protein